ncbi:MAG: hypothetical protein WDO14_09130 [Bacteroidota bacterium]
MAMTEREQKEYRTYCSSLSSDYGFDISTTNPISPAMYIFHKEMQLCIETNKEIASEIKSAASKIHPEVLHFSSSEAAWSFQLGIIYRWALFGGLTLLLIWIAAWWWSMKVEIDQARIIVKNSGNIDVLAKQVRQDKDGYYFIEFTAPRSDTIKYFTDFQVINAKKVRVFLGKESKDK